MLATIVRLISLGIIGVSQASQLTNVKDSLGINTVNIPQINFGNTNNEIQILSNIEGLTFYQYQGQQNFTGSIDTNSNTHGLIYYSNDTLIKLLEGSDNTKIDQIVPLDEDAFILSGSGTLGGFQLENQLLYNLSDLSIIPLFNNQLQNIKSILVDKDIVYFGGNFSYTSNNKTANSIISWNKVTKNVDMLPFIGFGKNSTVNSILKLDEDNLLFFGDFSTLDDKSLLVSNITTYTQQNSTSSSSTETNLELEQQISLKYASWASLGDLKSSTQFICPNGQNEAWSSAGTTGEITCNLAFEASLSKIRIFNSPYEQDQIASFRIVTAPSNGIMNLTYLDPLTSEVKYCDAFCPLYSSNALQASSENATTSASTSAFINGNKTNIGWSTDYQEFAFVNQVPVTALQVIALTSYGDNVGLSGFQLYQNSYSIFANNSLNEPACDSPNTVIPSSYLSNNIWYQGLNSQSYIATKYTPGDDPSPLVNFYPSINRIGNYTVNIYTPGCTGDGTCSFRGIVNVTLWDTATNDLISTTLIYQNNNEMKYDQLFEGFLDYAPKVTLEYYSGINDENSPVVVVADNVDLVPINIELDETIGNVTSSTEELKVPLNGMFQYQLSNFTSSNNNSTLKVDNTSLNLFPVSRFSSSVSLYGVEYNETLLLGGSIAGVYALSLSNYTNIRSTRIVETGGEVTGTGAYAGGVVLFGNFNISNRIVSSLSYNGTFDSFGNVNSNIATFSNLTFGESEILAFNNEYFFNTSTSSYIFNTSALSLSIWSAGSNDFGDTLFSGLITRNEFPNLNNSAVLTGNGTAQSLQLRNGIQPYLGVYLNDSLTAYLYDSSSNSNILFSNGLQGNWNLPRSVSSAYYSDNETMFVGSSLSNGDSGAELFVLNFTTMDLLYNETFDVNSSINSIVSFGRNSSLLVGGDFTAPNTNCSNLCLLNLGNNQWSSFSNKFDGTITGLEFANDSRLLISGSYRFENQSGISLGYIDLNNQEFKSLLSDSQKVNSFNYNNGTIVAWDSSTIYSYRGDSWSNHQIPNTNSSTSIKNVQIVSKLNNSLSTNNTSNNLNDELILVFGELYSEDYGFVQAMFYDFQNWIPYYITQPYSSLNTSKNSLFMNKDISLLYESQVVLQNPNSTISISSTSSSSATTRSSSTSSTSLKNGNIESKIHRGYVVLIGLALAIGTVAILGIFGVTMAYIFSDDKGEYVRIKPRIDEHEMLDTVPPEKLMKFI
ncbi:hypothetical protein Kpol_392p10 [Vanderwaltozyma polyspora DSM 70294]|uniref:Bud site selection protein RAX2 n=1 Tax=Vanderwaltozyma polyspora (strain ATCC 22028 / DSM 70294 / BCRC 21397 / CBS 2163 / NBRC 10782 / NRRL Y-8283 / UCD 57-17) TaxID=436907 RepID=A7TRS1_VANPO|nr:uncharacterized protein Kpol_392p10 [Vanderwaltozyma polyspora DSM 70294]EDO15043.1 hypothetical protein Kpol_392p10 [Vanderwaltozyma polyspora DSM 70294]